MTELEQHLPPVQHHMPLVSAVPLADLLAGWEDYYSVAIENALARSYQHNDRIEAMIESLATGHALAIDVRIAGIPTGIGVVETIETKNGPYTNIWTLTGSGMDLWSEDFLDYVEDLARSMGHRGVMLSGRKGWSKIKALKGRGYETEAIIMMREFMQ